MSAMRTVLIDTIGGFDLYEQDDGNGDALFVTPRGSKNPIGSAWGPSADDTGEWFASRWLTETAAVRVADRQAAIDYLTTEAVTR